MSARPCMVLKVGGALVADAEGLAPLWASVATLRGHTDVVIVHGGGPQATALARRLGHTPRMVHGRRVTTDLDLDIVTWVLRGQVNTALVAQAHAAGLPAVGTSALDAGTVQVTKRPPWTVDGETVDFGWVGDVAHVDPAYLRHVLAGGYLPVVASLGMDASGHVYNVNADTIACVIAEALQASAFGLVTEAGGVRRHAEDPVSHLTTCTRAQFEAGVAEGWIAGGMRPKLTVAFRALDSGIPDVRILAPHDLDRAEGGTRVVG
ncbi:MAG: acetylglutamate kinase [Bacteroidota bacterium]